MFTIYERTNTVNKKSYIGFTTREPSMRWKEHLREAKCGSMRTLSCAIRKHGQGVFVEKILEVGENEEYGKNVAEPMYIAWLKPEYNQTAGGEGTLNRVTTEKTKKKQSSSHKTSAKAIEHRRKLAKSTDIQQKKSKRLTGIPRNLDTRITLSIAAKVSTKAIEHRRKLAESRRKPHK